MGRASFRGSEGSPVKGGEKGVLETCWWSTLKGKGSQPSEILQSLYRVVLCVVNGIILFKAYTDPVLILLVIVWGGENWVGRGIVAGIAAWCRQHLLIPIDPSLVPHSRHVLEFTWTYQLLRVYVFFKGYEAPCTWEVLFIISSVQCHAWPLGTLCLLDELMLHLCVSFVINNIVEKK